MAYKQPRVPLLREGGNLYQFVKELVRFLVDFSVSAWNADRLKDEELKTIKQELDRLQSGGLTIDSIYPVGSIYMSVQATNPATFFGGTWERLKDRFLLGAGDSYAAGNTGGEAAHTLTVAEMPQHTHTSRVQWQNTPSAVNTVCVNGSPVSVANVQGNMSVDNGDHANIGYTGGGQAHNNMPPYLAVHMWKRTG